MIKGRSFFRRRRLSRNLHPLAWWIWAISLAIVATRTTNPLLLVLIICCVGFVVANRRGDAFWSRAFRYYLLLGVFVIAVRIFCRSLFGGDVVTKGATVLFSTPHIPLPVHAGVQLGGAVTLNATLTALYGGLSLATLLCCIGAANALSNPKRALALLPGAFYELGVAVVVAISVAPQLIESISRVRKARTLRGGKRKGHRGVSRVVIPVVADAFDRSLHLAAAMDARGYGRKGTTTPKMRRLISVLLIGGLCALCVGLYGVVDESVPRALGVGGFACGVSVSLVAIYLAGKGVKRSRYRPDRFGAAEWMVVATGLIPAVEAFGRFGIKTSTLHPATMPLSLPTFALPFVAATLCALLAGFIAPPPRRGTVVHALNKKGVRGEPVTISA